MWTRLLVACAFLLALTSCGTDTGGPETIAEIHTQHLDGEPGVDFPSVLATAGDDALVLMLSDDGVLQPHLSRGGAAFSKGEPLSTGIRFAGLGGAVRTAGGSWFSLGSGGMERVDGDDRATYRPIGLRSDDGLAWEEVTVTGFTGPVEFNDLVEIDGAIIAAGSYRTAENPSSGGFRAAVWVSSDGRQFTEVVVPGASAAESYVGHLELADGKLLAAGRVGRDGALWASSDGGRTWAASDDPVVRDAYALSGLEATGRTVVATPAEDAGHLLRSTDGGATWAKVTAPGGGGEGWSPLWSAAGRFMTIGGGNGEAWSRPEVCYADLGQCGRAPDAALFASEDGVDWTRLDTTGLGEVDEVAGTDSGSTLVLAGADGGLSLGTWPAGADLPVGQGPADPHTIELTTPPADGQPEVGVRYHAPFYVHCGMDWFWLGETTWRRTDAGPGLEAGAEATADWPVSGQMIYGYATVQADGLLEYSIDGGEVIATYERASGAPGCM
ncbi:sialidase family protein [Nocardioides speluncae]|uniref:sialidase family protein n=1 Tax=Nocardioides speluncae TaxID=2670337 RepID=UPI0012B17CD7|nr:hypothetical protein [Nocardioides speluncae]